MSNQRVLIIDDETDIRELLEITLQRMGLETRAAATLAEARTLLASADWQLCLTDMRLPDGSGIDLVREISADHPGIPVAVITAFGSMDTAIDALKAGAFDFVNKPLQLEDLRRLVGQALRLTDPAQPSTEETAMVGEAPAMQALKSRIARVARSQAPVTITGESGTGKELAARLIHERGPRAGQPFIPVNCGAIPAELMESEFFGHRRGSFTGAIADRDGLFAAADGGTLFLDEVAELPLEMQVKLLRAIQEKRIRPVGATQEIPVDVRILSATHRDLDAAKRAGHFREDLFYRINVITLHVPPLRERGDDIALLAERILQRLATDYGQPVPTLDASACAALQTYPFPGNVRELENVLERALALAENHALTAADLQLQDRLPSENREPTAEIPADDSGESFIDQIAAQQKQILSQTLERCRWNRTAAARELGLTYRQLRYRLQKLGLD